jgi:3-isopropylmalate/(R)-2-methylmalate dehydratase small subunit
MEPFTSLTDVAAALPQPNIDTDIIFPARFLLLTQKAGLGRYAFYDWRYAADGREIADFVLNRAPYRAARLLVAGENFGCGSSREQAVWALRDFGVRVVVARSFGEIFHNNCFKNGVLPIVLASVAELEACARAQRPITVDLESQTITGASCATLPFEIEPWRREALLQGWDEVSLILNQRSADIDAFEQRHGAANPWLHSEG